jgi:hypothetical protein
MQRMYSPSPTVRSSSVPFYLRGMSQYDTLPPDLPVGPIDTSMPLAPDISSAIPGLIDTSPGIFSTTGMDVQPLIDAGLDPNTADLVLAASVNHEITDAQFQAILGGQMSGAQISNLIFGPTGTNVPAGPYASQAAQQAAAQAARAGGTAAQIAAAAAAVKPGSTSAQIASAVASALKSKPTITIGPSPRIATSPTWASLTQASILPGVPNIAIIGGAVLLLAMMGKR